MPQTTARAFALEALTARGWRLEFTPRGGWTARHVGLDLRTGGRDSVALYQSCTDLELVSRLDRGAVVERVEA